MKDTCKILSYVFLAISLGFGNVQAGTESNWSNRLSLKLAVNYESGKIKSQKIPFTVTMINKTNERLHLDLAPHKDEITNQLFVEFTARFELLRYDSNDMDLSILDSNKAKYEIVR